jgi:hypothetical protein
LTYRFHITRLFTATLFLLLLSQGRSQTSEGGFPPGLTKFPYMEMTEIRLHSPDAALLRMEDTQAEKRGEPDRVGVVLEANIDLLKQGVWTTLEDGSAVCRLMISSEGAYALVPYFNAFRLSPGNRLFIYDAAGGQVKGAFSHRNNHPSGYFAVELIAGESMIVEYHQKKRSGFDEVVISEVGYHYKKDGIFIEGMTSDHCEVNMNCSPEGDDWQDQKRGIARILLKAGGGNFWCTGSLVNNTRRDRTPYFLTANHCGENASTEDYLQWVFYFNFESPDCEGFSSGPDNQTLTGSEVMSRYDEGGSDFKLLLLQEEIPDSYEPYFNGWDRTEEISSRGVCIHHPAGDVKKVSTYTTPLLSSTWNGGESTHWEVVWSETPNGHGVTEGGSSGAPIFSSDGYILGALTGGLAACEPGGGGPGTGPDKPDFFGKIYWSWDQNGTALSERLKEWLDPDNTGMEKLRGINSILTADFEASARTILIGNSVEFTNISSGSPNQYEWYFEGGTPAVSFNKEPGTVIYDSAGVFSVTLIVIQGANSDTLVQNDFIEVIGKVYPNPTRGLTSIFLGEELTGFAKVEVFDISGRLMYENRISSEGFNQIRVDLTGFHTGLYTVRITRDQRFSMHKVMVVR